MAVVKMNDHKTGVETADVILDGFPYWCERGKCHLSRESSYLESRKC